MVGPRQTRSRLVQERLLSIRRQRWSYRKKGGYRDKRGNHKDNVTRDPLFGNPGVKLKGRERKEVGLSIVQEFIKDTLMIIMIYKRQEVSVTGEEVGWEVSHL